MPDYPGSYPTNGSLLIAANNLSGVLANTITAVATSLTLQDSSDFPAAGAITIESEAILYNGNATATGILSNLTRGSDSQAAQHNAGTTVFAYLVSAHHNRLKDEVIEIADDLRTSFSGDLDDTAGPSTTASDLTERLGQIANRLAALGNSTDWKSGSPGKIVAATQTALAPATSTSSGTMQTTGLTCTASMGTTTAKAIVSVNVGCAGNTSSNDLYIGLRRGSTDLGPYAASRNQVGSHAFTVTDSPNTNGSVTYHVTFRGDGVNTTFFSFLSTSSIIRIETLYA